MVRRRLTVKRLDPWSVLKFGVVANLVGFAIGLLVAGVVWFIVDRLELVDQACSIILDVGFESCAVDGGHLFRILALLGGMGVVVATAVMVFSAFLYNLIADLTGGLTIGVVEDGVGRPRPEGPAGHADTSWPARSEPREPVSRQPTTADTASRPDATASASGSPEPAPRGTEGRSDAARAGSSPTAGPDDDLFGSR